MTKIVNIKQAVEISKELKNKSKSIVLVGGCFDILHLGHIIFLEKAKQQGDFIFVLLESDEKIEKIKGKNRPINSQKDRALILAALKAVDYVVLLPKMNSDQDYESLIFRLKPSIIAITKGDPNKSCKEKQAIVSRAKIIEVVDLISDKSTTKLAELITGDL